MAIFLFVEDKVFHYIRIVFPRHMPSVLKILHSGLHLSGSVIQSPIGWNSIQHGLTAD